MLMNHNSLLIRLARSVSVSVLGLALVLAATPASTEPFNSAAAGDSVIRAEQWELVRKGDKVVSLDALNRAVKRWAASTNKMIEIQYPGGEEGEIWMNELRGWLISLGVASKYLLAVPGSGQEDLIRLKIINAGDSF